MINIAICDDEEYFQKREKLLITEIMDKYGHEYNIDIFSAGKELIAAVVKVEYNIVFIDINMAEIDGIETAKKIRSLSNDVYIVFVTGFLSYALEGYKVEAVRYILKDDDYLEKTFYECVEAILKKMNYEQKKEKFLFKEGTKEIAVDDIEYIESNLHKLTFYINNITPIKYNMYEKLDVIESKLESYNFIRIHKSYLVNLKYIDMIERYQTRLKNETVLNIAKPRYPEVRKKYLSYKGDL